MKGEAIADGDRLHTPVMLQEILDFMAPCQGKLVIDGTLGFGGHSERLLEAGASVIGIDQDPAALEKASERLRIFGDQFQALHGNAADLPVLLEHAGLSKAVDGVIFDLGVSSWQLDQPERGFSFQKDGPLDMRMNPQSETTAAMLVNTLAEEELASLFWEYGEERHSRRVARALVKRRQSRPFARSLDLADTIARCVPRSGRLHPATRSFQGLRIAVNREMEVLPAMLEHATALLRPGGKLAVISFHSLEDRIVKNFLRDRSRAQLDDPTWPEPRPNPNHVFDLPKRLVKPTEEEASANPRARSARLRLAVKRAT